MVTTRTPKTPNTPKTDPHASVSNFDTESEKGAVKRASSAPSEGPDPKTVKAAASGFEGVPGFKLLAAESAAEAAGVMETKAPDTSGLSDIGAASFGARVGNSRGRLSRSARDARRERALWHWRWGASAGARDRENTFFACGEGGLGDEPNPTHWHAGRPLLHGAPPQASLVGFWRALLMAESSFPSRVLDGPFDGRDWSFRGRGCRFAQSGCSDRLFRSALFGSYGLGVIFQTSACHL